MKVGYRSILKHRKSSLINLIGLGIAFSTCLVIFTFMDRVYNMDALHPHSERTFLIESVREDNGKERIFGNVPFALSTAIKEEIPEVEDAVRIQYSSADFRYQDKVFNEQIIFADEGYFNTFAFTLSSGSKDVLKDKDRVVLSKNIAKKYFGEEEALGKQVSMLFSANGKEYKETYIVGAVADDFDYMTTVRFNVLLPFNSRLNLGYFDDSDWNNHPNATFVTLKSVDQQQMVLNQINGYTKIQNEANPDKIISNFLLDPLPDYALDASGKEEMVVYNAPMVARVLLSVIAIFILILAVFNYINISVVSATSRLKEIGLRKTIGGTRKQIIIQFISENTILCFLALVFGYLLTVGFTLPGFNTIVGKSSPLALDLMNPRLWMYLLSLFLFISLGSASYPAFFVSKFRPVQIFKGNLKLSSKNYFAKTLLTVQFVISFMTISLAVVFVLNNEFLKNRDWGYNKEQTIIIPLVYSDQYSELKDVFSQNPGIRVISGSSNHMGYWTEEDALEYNSEKFISKKIMCGFEYLDVMGIRMKSGRFFENNSSNDLKESIVVNEALVKKLNLTTPVGTRVVLDGEAQYIVGVAEDFHYMDFGHDIKPLFFKVVNESNYNLICLRTAPGKAVQTEEYALSTWKKLYPDNTYEGYFQNEAFDVYYQEEQGISNFMTAIAGMAILIASMGLFGLVSLFISKRMKEFSIRKVMGASLREIGIQVSKGFIWVMVIATILGTPLAFFMTKSIVESLYSYHVPLNAVPFIFTGMILIFTALLTVSTQILKAIGVNPAEQLRNE